VLASLFSEFTKTLLMLEEERACT